MSHSVREQNGASKSVYRLELNVGLVNNARWFDGRTKSYARAGADLRTLLDISGGKAFALRGGTSIHVEHVQGTEPTLFIACNLNAGAPLAHVATLVGGMVHNLARMTGQEAIAWRLTAIQSQSDTQENETVEGLDGPKADAWRPFNPAFFVTRRTPVEPGPHWAHV